MVTGGPDERALTARVAGPPAPRVTDLGGATTSPSSPACSPAPRCVVVGNTGPAHLAAAVGTPVVSLFAPTVPAVRWRPWRVPHELLYVDVPCAGCRARECPVPGHPCLGGVMTDDVLAAVAGSRPSRWRRRREDPALARPRRLDHGVRPWRPRLRRPGAARGRGPDGVGIARTYDWPRARVRELPPEALADEDFDVVVLQRPRELEGLAESWLGRRPGRDLPAVYVEHNAPQGRIAEMRHPAADRDDLTLVHVTHFNALFWDAGATPTRVIEHGIVDPGPRYTGELPRGAVVINEARRRARVTGTDLLGTLRRGRRRSTCSASTRRT